MATRNAPSESPIKGAPQVTVVVPSFNQGQFLNQTLESIFQQRIHCEVFVLDGGSTDSSLDVIRRWETRLAGWRSHADNGQSDAINEGISMGSAPFVCWLNSDDYLIPDGLLSLVNQLEQDPDAPAAYGKAWNLCESSGKQKPVWIEPFSWERLAVRCIISQPATLIRRSAWETVCGVDPSLNMAMDYDLWWRLSKKFGPMRFVDTFVAVNRIHPQTKTSRMRRAHYAEAMRTVRSHHGRVPLKWWLAQPYAIWFKFLAGYFTKPSKLP